MHNLPDMDDVVFQLDIDSISADQKNKDAPNGTAIPVPNTEARVK